MESVDGKVSDGRSERSGGLNTGLKGRSLETIAYRPSVVTACFSMACSFFFFFLNFERLKNSLLSVQMI